MSDKNKNPNRFWSITIKKPKIKENDVWMSGRCRTCRFYRTDSGMCVRVADHPMQSRPEQNCKSFERRKENVQ